MGSPGRPAARRKNQKSKALPSLDSPLFLGRCALAAASNAAPSAVRHRSHQKLGPASHHSAIIDRRHQHGHDRRHREVRMRPAWQRGTAFRVHACCPPPDAPALHVEPAHARSVTAMHSPYFQRSAIIIEDGTCDRNRSCHESHPSANRKLMCVDRYRRRHRLRTPSTVLGDGAPAIVWEGILQLQVMRDGAHTSRLDDSHLAALIGANG